MARTSASPIDGAASPVGVPPVGANEREKKNKFHSPDHSQKQQRVLVFGRFYALMCSVERNDENWHTLMYQHINYHIIYRDFKIHIPCLYLITTSKSRDLVPGRFYYFFKFLNSQELYLPYHPQWTF